MYEKPQYLTPDGYKRLSKNPYSDLNALQRLELLKKKRHAALIKQSMKKEQGTGLSDEAAVYIAQVLKGMLHSHD